MAINSINHQLNNLIKGRQFFKARELLKSVGLTVQVDPRVKIKEKTKEHLPNQLVFICGLHRSGTTLIHDYICKNYDIMRIAQARVPEDEGQFLQDVFAVEKPYGGPGSFAFFKQMQFDPVFDTLAAAKARERLLRLWSAWDDSSSNTLIEKSPPNIVRISYLRSIFPGAKFVIWTRDPRAVSLATHKWHSLPIQTLMMHWCVAYMKAFEDLSDDCILTSYEDFCLSPDTQLERIAKFCNLEKKVQSSEIQGRFQLVKNTNPEYIERFPKNFKFRGSVKAWEIFGYSFDQ
jgi:hypothetical protein